MVSALAISALLTGCAAVTPAASTLQRYEYTELHMASLFRITLFAPDKQSADTAAVAAFERVNELNEVMSDYDPTSELNRLCGQPVGKPVTVSDDLFRILSLAQTLSDKSGGAFDVTVGPFSQLWRSARKRKVLPDEKEIADARSAVGWKNLRLDPRKQTVTLLAPNMRLDLGGIAKGYAADEALKVLRMFGNTRAMVAASGDIAVGDPPPGERGWRIGIGSFDAGSNQTERVLYLKRCGVSTSGDSEQFVEIGGNRYSHMVNPRTGLGLTERIQTTVIAPNATLSDSLATAVSVLGVNNGLSFVAWQSGAAAFITTRDRLGSGNTFKTKNFPGN